MLFKKRIFPGVVPPFFFLVAAAFLASCGTDQSPIASDQGLQPAKVAKPLAQKISIEKLKRPRSITRPDGRVVEKRVHVFYKTEFEPQEHSQGSGGKGGGKKGSGDKGGDKKCFALSAKDARWKTTEPYVLDPANGDELKKKFVASRIAASLETWNAAAGFALFGPRDTHSRVDGADTDSPDGKNEVLFENIDEPGVIAFTIVWGVFSGPPSDRELLEWGLVLDDPVLGELGLGLEWGDAGETSETELGDLSIMDLQNIATHEMGHAAGLIHPSPSNHCAEETMYRIAEEGETKKRTLNTGDLEGLSQLYP